MSSARLPNRVHRERPWRIHGLVDDFRLEDVWVLPTPGGERDDFPRFVEAFAAASTTESPSRLSRLLWRIRWELGDLLGWDEPETGLGSRVESIRDRLPADLREGPGGPEFESLPFTSLYQLADEWAAEVANETVHGVMHMGWVDHGDDYRAEMAVYVKPNGLLGQAYMAAIRPFRHIVVYPPMLRQIEVVWRREKAAAVAAAGS